MVKIEISWLFSKKNSIGRVHSSQTNQGFPLHCEHSHSVLITDLRRVKKCLRNLILCYRISIPKARVWFRSDLLTLRCFYSILFLLRRHLHSSNHKRMLCWGLKIVSFFFWILSETISHQNLNNTLETEGMNKLFIWFSITPKKLLAKP